VSIFNVLVQLLLEILARSQPLRLVAMQLEIVEEVGDVPVQLLRLRRRQVGARGEGHELAQDARLLGCLDGSARHQLDPSRVATWRLDFGLGLPAIIGERGIAVSGGQRQRIAIARAMIKNAPILILDEATSALDNESEASIKTAIDSLRKDRTTILVAHRLSTVKDADWIVALDKGVVSQEGKHKDLLLEEGLYRSLYASTHDGPASYAG
jgi:ABC-type multidrug transport system fused ATPase/permease subunit